MGCTSGKASLTGDEKPLIIQIVKEQQSTEKPEKKNKHEKQEVPEKRNEQKFEKENGQIKKLKSQKENELKRGETNDFKAKRISKELVIIDNDFERELQSTGLKGEEVRKNAKDKLGVGVESKIGQLDSEAEQLFEIGEIGHGDEFMAVLPWKGAIKEPTNHPKPNPAKPTESYSIDFAYGYKNEEVRQNLFYNSTKKPVYMTAAVGVIFDPKTRTQKFFGGGETMNMERKQTDTSLDSHTDDIMALAINQERTMVTTGQVGHQPIIFVWDANTAEKICMMRLPKGMRSVTALGFNKDSSMIAASDLSNDHNVYVYRVSDQSLIFSDKSGPDKIFMLHWSLFDDTFCTVGPKTIFFWKPLAGQKKQKGTFGSVDKTTNIICVAYDEKGVAYTGAQNGQIIKWQGASMKSGHQIHKGVVHAIKYVIDLKENASLLFSGAADMMISIQNPDTMAIIKQIQAESVPRSLDYSRFLLVGLRNGNIVEYDIQSGAKEVIMHSHHDGEVWGLCLLPGTSRFVTSADDNKILMYDITTRKCVQRGLVNPVEEDPQDKTKRLNAPAAYTGGASSMSSEPPDRQSRAVAFNQTLNHLAVAVNHGWVTIRQYSQQSGSDLNTILFTLKDSKEWVECMAYNPMGDRLAVGSHDNKIYVYNAKNKYQKHHAFAAHSSFITCLDWSLDGSYIRSCCGAYELLFFNVDAKKQDSGGASNTVGTEWASMTCKLGWSVQGIYPPGCDGTHINGVDLSSNQSLIATGDDYGLVNIYRNPALEGHEAKSFRGHSEHVTRIAFTMDDEYILSVGGMDQTVIQWKRN